MYLVYSDLKNNNANQESILGKFIHGNVDGESDKNVLTINFSISKYAEDLGKWENEELDKAEKQENLKELFTHYANIRQKSNGFIIMADKDSRISKMTSVSKGKEFELTDGEKLIAQEDMDVFAFMRMVNFLDYPKKEEEDNEVKVITRSTKIETKKAVGSLNEESIKKEFASDVLDAIMKTKKEIAGTCIEKNYLYNEDGLKVRVSIESDKKKNYLVVVDFEYETIPE